MAREIVLGTPSPPIPTGQMAYRVTLPVTKLHGIPELEEIITVPRNNHWIGPYGTILSYLLQGVNETLINFVFMYGHPYFHLLILRLTSYHRSCDVNRSKLPEGIDQKMGTSTEIRESFKGWDPRLATSALQY